ncbi:MAG TPA: LrgB family protein [Bacillales bacterium]|nr:LrgB family protein [Bacillales bacterium]
MFLPQPLLAIIIIIGTILIYLAMCRLYRHFPVPFLLPILTSLVTIALLLRLSGFTYATYMTGGRWIDALLGPAVVSLAFPLFQQRKVLFANAVPIAGGVLAGSVAGLVSGLGFAAALGASRPLALSLLPKSVTTPVATAIAVELGGVPALAVVFVMVAGIGGAVIGPLVMKLFRIRGPLAQGVAFGSGSHVIGTSKATEYGEDTASVSSVAMTLSAVSASVFAPVVAWWFYG